MTSGDLWRIVALAAVASVATTVHPNAQELCSEPIPPHCVDADAPLADEFDVTRCRTDVSEFAKELQAYEACIDRKIKELRARLASARDKLESMESDK